MRLFIKNAIYKSILYIYISVVFFGDKGLIEIISFRYFELFSNDFSKPIIMKWKILEFELWLYSKKFNLSPKVQLNLSAIVDYNILENFYLLDVIYSQCFIRKPELNVR